ncbi:MAG: glycosyltransferase family 2 protein [Cyclobacteriaceae bacterium]
MHKDKLVTVCITTFNRKQLLSRAVESVLQQTYSFFELIIVDDCSIDGTEEVVNKLSLRDERIRYIRHESNKGLAAARNTAIFNSKGTYFTFVDDDDRWCNNYLMECVRVANDFDDEWCFCCGSITEDLLGQTVYAKYDNLEGPLLDFIQQGYTPPVASQFYFTSTLQRYGGYREEVKNGVDHDLWLTLGFQGVKIKSVDQYLSLPSEVIDISREKMTNSYNKRINGLLNSLEVWKPEISAHYGEHFYTSFKKAYIVREKKKFFRIYTLKFKLKQAFEIYSSLEEKVSMKEIVKSVFIATLLRLSVPIRRKKYVKRGASLKIKTSLVTA